MVAKSQTSEVYSSTATSSHFSESRAFASSSSISSAKSSYSLQNYFPNVLASTSSQIGSSSVADSSAFAGAGANVYLGKSSSQTTSHVRPVSIGQLIINPQLNDIRELGDINENSDPIRTTTTNLLLKNATDLTPNVVPNVTISTTIPPSSGFPLFAILISALLVLMMTSAVLYFLCRCLTRRRKRRSQLTTMTPKASDPRLAGVRADQPIQFVVPTTIIISETAEDSPSETDYSSGGPRQLPIRMDKKRKRPFSSFHINPEDLQRGLYEGVTSRLESGAFLGDLGKLGFSLLYNTQRNQLCVRIIGAIDLPCFFLKTTANPCVKIVMLPDKTPKYITKVQRNTINPVFNEIFWFPVMKNDLDTKKLKISVWDYDKFSRKLLIGQIVYSLKDSGLTSALNVDSTTGDIWIDLKQDSDSYHKGSVELLFSLCYNPEISSLTISILKIRGLDMGDKEKETFVYTKVTLYVCRKMAKTKRTSSKRKTPFMEFNTSFQIHVPLASISEVDLLVTVCEKSSGLGSKKIMGRTQVGSSCLSDQGLQHWQDMLLSPKSTCAQWHILSLF